MQAEMRTEKNRISMEKLRTESHEMFHHKIFFRQSFKIISTKQRI